MTDRAADRDSDAAWSLAARLADVYGWQFWDGDLGRLAAAAQRCCGSMPACLAGLGESLRRRAHIERCLLRELAVSETWFMRAPDQLEAAAARLLHRLRTGASVRALSVGCASGEEPYSLAMLLDARGAAQDKVRLLGVDVNPTALARARTAIYSKWSLRETSSLWRARYFEASKSGFVLKADLASWVQFREENICTAAGWTPEPAAYDVVFCRNLLMYLSPLWLARTVQRLAKALAPDGRLYVGASESPAVANCSDLVLVEEDGAFAYSRRVSAAAAPVPGTTRVAAPPTPPPPACPAVDAGAEARYAAQRLQASSAADRLKEAHALLKAAPDDPDVLLFAALCYAHAPDADEALRLAVRACDHDAAFAMARLHLGLWLQRRGAGPAGAALLQAARERLMGETQARIDAFGGGFSRESLLSLCAQALAAETSHGPQHSS